MKTEMPPTAISEMNGCHPWEMPKAPEVLDSSPGSPRYDAFDSLCRRTPSLLSSSPSSQPDSGLQSSDCLSEEEVEADKTLAKQTASDEHRLSRAVKVERLGQKTQPAPYHKSSRPNSPKVSGAEQKPLQLLEKMVAPASDAERWLAKLVNSIQIALDLEKFEDFQCVSEAKKLLEVTKRMAEGHQLHHFLRVFGHSVSCGNKQCVKPCLMFRRIRGHLITVNHECAIVHVYSQLTRMHVDTCVTEKCGFPTCKGLQAYRAREKNEVLPRNFYLLERENALALGKRSPSKKEVEKYDQKSGNALAAKEEAAAPKLADKENAAPKLAAQTLAKEETCEAVDLSDRVSKLKMGSSPSGIPTSA